MGGEAWCLVADALKLFDSMVNPNEVPFTAMMEGLVLSGSVEEATKLFMKMHRRDVPIDMIAVSSILGACARAMEDGPNHDIVKNLLG